VSELRGAEPVRHPLPEEEEALMGLLCRLLGHRYRPHYAATPTVKRVGVRCTRCARVQAN
jgi:hypothetical protein